ncbi:hypothetical protein Droror1_Dr00014857 [Drosera rotundifolia]
MNRPCRAFVAVMYMYVSSCPRQAFNYDVIIDGFEFRPDNGRIGSSLLVPPPPNQRNSPHQHHPHLPPPPLIVAASSLSGSLSSHRCRLLPLCWASTSLLNKGNNEVGEVLVLLIDDISRAWYTVCVQ